MTLDNSMRALTVFTDHSTIYIKRTTKDPELPLNEYITRNIAQIAGHDACARIDKYIDPDQSDVAWAALNSALTVEPPAPLQQKL